MLLKDTWKKLLEKGIDVLNSVGISPAKWSFGGGTALYAFWKCPRVSKDVDIFITDAQLLTYLSPRLNDIADSLCAGNYVEQSNFVKLILEEGSIDFIVAPRLTEKPVVKQVVEPFGEIQVDTPWEVIAKKFFYRADYFTVRDAIDLLSVIELYRSQIPDDFWHLLKKRAASLTKRWKVIRPHVEGKLAEIVLDPDRIHFVKSINTPKDICHSFDRFLEEVTAVNNMLQKRNADNFLDPGPTP